MSMAFCGQCGYHLTAGLSSCPRCGAAVEAEIGPIEGASHADDQTIASRAFVARNPVEPAASNNPQRLVLRPGPDGGSFRETYPSMASQFPGASQSGIPLQGYSHGYTAQADFQQRMQQAQYQQELTAQNTRGRNTGLVLILVGLLFILSTVVLFIIHNTSNTHSGPPDITAT
ncbi:MAG: hypothetical protein J2P36_35120, partial [Ktedonobacteraceae bacterium]|nr:hypothetical protein [Ktedonobacteraceae bacterium]